MLLNTIHIATMHKVVTYNNLNSCVFSNTSFSIEDRRLFPFKSLGNYRLHNKPLAQDLADSKLLNIIIMNILIIIMPIVNS